MATSKTWSNLSAFEKDTGVRANGVREQVSSCSLPFIIKEWKVDHRKAKHTYDAEGNRRTVPQKSRTLDSVFQDVPYPPKLTCTKNGMGDRATTKKMTMRGPYALTIYLR